MDWGISSENRPSSGREAVEIGHISPLPAVEFCAGFWSKSSPPNLGGDGRETASRSSAVHVADHEAASFQNGSDSRRLLFILCNLPSAISAGLVRISGFLGVRRIGKRYGVTTFPYNFVDSQRMSALSALHKFASRTAFGHNSHRFHRPLTLKKLLRCP